MTPRLRQSAPRAVRVLLRELLDTTAQTAIRLGNTDDAEALHDFRVALRRLRANLRAYRKSLRLGDDVDPGKRARRLARSTSAARDREVQLDWLRRQQRSAKPKERHELDTLIGQWQAQHAAEQSQLRRRARAEFAVLDAELRHCLRHPVARTHEAAEPFAHLAARQLRAHGKRLARCLAAIDEQADDDAAHAARIAGKRLRYLLEPLIVELRGAAQLIKRLKSLQDLLGELHDCEVLLHDLHDADRSADAPRVSPALARRTKARRAELYLKLQQDLTAEQRASWLATTSRMAEKLERTGGGD